MSSSKENKNKSSAEAPVRKEIPIFKGKDGKIVINANAPKQVNFFNKLRDGTS